MEGAKSYLKRIEMKPGVTISIVNNIKNFSFISMEVR
jgi:hypothetical protein